MELKDCFFSKIRMTDVKKIEMTSLILTSKEVEYSKEHGIRPQGINCLLRAKQFSAVSLVKKVVFVEHQEMQLQMASYFILNFQSFQE